MAETNGTKYPTWKWLAGILVTILILLTGYTFGTAIGDVKADVKTLGEKKLDKVQYQADLSDLKAKVDCIYNWHLPKELRK